jgi:hypothetical protein
MRPVSDHQASGREMLQRTAKSCGPDAPTLASSSWSCVGPTGLRQNISADDGGKTARSPGRARRKPLNHCVRECRAIPVYSLLLVCVLPIQSAHEAAGATGTRHSPRPPRGREFRARLGRIASRGANAHLKLFWLFEKSRTCSGRSAPSPLVGSLWERVGVRGRGLSTSAAPPHPSRTLSAPPSPQGEKGRDRADKSPISAAVSVPPN